MTAIQKTLREAKEIEAKLDIEYKKLSKRLENYDREERQLSLLQQNISNIQDLSEELLIQIEKIALRRA